MGLRKEETSTLKGVLVFVCWGNQQMQYLDSERCIVKWLYEMSNIFSFSFFSITL